MKRLLLPVYIFLITLLAAACGTAATPVPNSGTLEAQAVEEATQPAEDAATEEIEEVAAVPTETRAPTETPVPPTATPTEIPPTEEPATPTIQATNDPLVLLINALGNPASGERIFDTQYDTAIGSWRCSQCHNTDSEERLVGPGLLNIRSRAEEERVPGMPAEVYVHTSIIEPNAYVVEGFPENLMPPNYEEILTEQQIYDLAAYVLSLGE